MKQFSLLKLFLGAREAEESRPQKETSPDEDPVFDNVSLPLTSSEKVTLTFLGEADEPDENDPAYPWVKAKFERTFLNGRTEEGLRYVFSGEVETLPVGEAVTYEHKFVRLDRPGLVGIHTFGRALGL